MPERSGWNSERVRRLRDVKRVLPIKRKQPLLPASSAVLNSPLSASRW